MFNGFEQLALTLKEIRTYLPELKDAKVSTIFLANLMWHLAKPVPYREFGDLDHTPRNSILQVWENIQKIAPENPYVIFAYKRIEELYDPESPFFDQELIDGPSYIEMMRNYLALPRPVRLHPTMGGRLDIVRRIVAGDHKPLN